jgi:hypothetical protein
MVSPGFINVASNGNRLRLATKELSPYPAFSHPVRLSNQGMAFMTIAMEGENV